MINIKVVIFLVAGAVTQGNLHIYEDQKIDLATLTNFVRCVRQQMVTGNPAADLVTFSPYQELYDYQFPWSLGQYIRTDFRIIHINWTGVADFSFKFHEVPSYRYDASTFEYIIFWKKLSIKGKWVRNRNFYGLESHDSGLVKIDLYKPEWRGNITLTRRDVVDLLVKSKVQKTRVNFTNMDKKEMFLAPFSKQMWYYLLNQYPLYDQFLGKYYKDKFTNEWLRDPKRIETVLKYCNKY